MVRWVGGGGQAIYGNASILETFGPATPPLLRETRHFRLMSESSVLDIAADNRASSGGSLAACPQLKISKKN